MTNYRKCDKCNQIIEPKDDYVKLQLIQHKEKRLIYSGVGHLCISCLNEFDTLNKSSTHSGGKNG